MTVSISPLLLFHTSDRNVRHVCKKDDYKTATNLKFDQLHFRYNNEERAQVSTTIKPKTISHHTSHTSSTPHSTDLQLRLLLFQRKKL